jgi:hypothetical protein
MVLEPVPFIWCEADGETRVNLTGFTIRIAEHTLPYAPAITPTNLAQGEFQLAAPTIAQAAQLKSGRSYGLYIVLTNGLGQGVDEFRQTLVVQ